MEAVPDVDGQGWPRQSSAAQRTNPQFGDARSPACAGISAFRRRMRLCYKTANIDAVFNGTLWAGREMMDPIRRTILATGVAATAVVTAGTRLFAQKTGQGGAAMGTYEKGSVRIHFDCLLYT